MGFMWPFFGDENLFTTSNLGWSFREVFLLAGYAVEHNRLGALLQEIETVKGRHGLTLRHLVKYNLKDNALKRYFDDRGESALLRTVQVNSEPLPVELLQLFSATKPVRSRGRGQARWEWSGFSRARSFALPSYGVTLGNRGGRHRR